MQNSNIQCGDKEGRADKHREMLNYSRNRCCKTMRFLGTCEDARMNEDKKTCMTNKKKGLLPIKEAKETHSCVVVDHITKSDHLQCRSSKIPA